MRCNQPLSLLVRYFLFIRHPHTNKIRSVGAKHAASLSRDPSDLAVDNL